MGTKRVGASVAQARLPRGAVRFIAAQSTSNACSVMELLTLSWLVLSPDELHLTPFHFTVLVAGQFLPVALVGPHYGRLAARIAPTRMWVWCLGAEACVSAVLGATLLAGAALPFWILVVYAALLGTLQAVEVPSRQTSLMTFLGEAFARGYALFASTSRMLSALAPLLAGLLLATVPIGVVFVVNGASFAVIFVVVTRDIAAGVDAPVPTTSDTPSPQVSIARWRPLLLLAFVLAAVGNQFPVTNVLALERLSHDNSFAFGLVSAALAAGAVLGPQLSRRAWGRADQATVAVAVTFGILEVTMGLVDSIVMYSLLAFCVGLAMSAFMVLAVTTVKERANAAERPGIMGWFGVVTIGLVPLGTLLTGLLATYGSTLTLTLTVPGVCCVLAGVGYAIYLRQGQAKQDVVPQEGASS